MTSKNINKSDDLYKTECFINNLDLFEQVFKEEKSNLHQHQCLKEAFKKRDLLPIYAYYEKQREDFDYISMFYFYRDYLYFYENIRQNTHNNEEKDTEYFKHEYFSRMVMKIIMDCCPDFMKYLTSYDFKQEDIYDFYNKNELNYHIKLALQELNKTFKMEKFKKDVKEAYECYLTSGDYASISNTKIILKSIMDYVDTL